LILGLISYVWTFNVGTSYSINKPLIIGFLLGLGLLTKALFIPITGAILFFVSIQNFAKEITFGNSLKLLKKLSLILFPVTKFYSHFKSKQPKNSLWKYF
jgi:hypothetical protein